MLQRPVLLLATACLIAAATCFQTAQAEVIFQADFDSPDAIVTRGGGAKLEARSTATATVTGEDGMGLGGYLRVTVPESNTANTPGNVELVPESPAHAPEALFQHGGEDGKHTLSGALSFVFRPSLDYTRDGAAPAGAFRPIDISNREREAGLRLIVSGTGGAGVMVKLADAEGHVAAAKGTFPMTAGEVYRFAVVFEADTLSGWTTLSLLAREGLDEMTMEDHRIAQTSLDLNEGRVDAGFGAGSFRFGALQSRGQPKTQSFDALRLDDAPPESFPSLDKATRP